MTAPDAGTSHHARRLALKLVAFLLLSGGAWAFVVAFVLVLVWPGSSAFSVPASGTHAWLDRRVAVAFGIAGAGLLLLGVAVSRSVRRDRTDLPTTNPVPPPRKSGGTNPVRAKLILVGGFLFLAAVILIRRLG